MSSSENYEPWQVPSQERRTNPYLDSLRMDLSRINEQLARATHKNHIKMLKAAARDVNAKIKVANSKHFETK